jgi:predicted nucleotidyltransferase
MLNDYQKKIKKDLELFTEKLKKIPEIAAIYYTGSTATEKWDEYSDIDIDIVIDDKDYLKIVKKLPKILSLWGPIKHWNRYDAHDEHYAFIGEDYLKVEIDPIKSSILKKGIDWDLKLVYDPKGLIRRTKKLAKKKIKPEVKDFEYRLKYGGDNLIYAVRHFARGQKFSALTELNQDRADLFQLLCKLRGVPDYELIRSAERVFSKKEWKLWEDAQCRSMEKKEFKRAILAIWNFMKYIEGEYEKQTGRKLSLGHNDKELLKLFSRTLKN